MSHPQLGSFAEIIIDSYFIIDLECNILDFNGAFRIAAATLSAKGDARPGGDTWPTFLLAYPTAFFETVQAAGNPLPVCSR